MQERVDRENVRDTRLAILGLMTSAALGYIVYLNWPTFDLVLKSFFWILQH